MFRIPNWTLYDLPEQCLQCVALEKCWTMKFIYPVWGESCPLKLWEVAKKPLPKKLFIEHRYDIVTNFFTAIGAFFFSAPVADVLMSR